jgi:hypothetical protein
MTMKSIPLILAAALLGAGTTLAQGNLTPCGEGPFKGGEARGQGARHGQQADEDCDGEGRGKGKGHRRGPRDGGGPRRGGEGRPGAA